MTHEDFLRIIHQRNVNRRILREKKELLAKLVEMPEANEERVLLQNEIKELEKSIAMT